MPKIPVYEQQTTPGGTLSFNADSGGQALTRGLASLAGGAQQTARNLQYAQEVTKRKAVADDMTAAHLAMTTASAHWSQYSTKTQVDTEGDPTGTWDRMAGEYKKYGEELVATAKTPEGKAYLSAEVAQLGASLYERMAPWEANRAVEYRGSLYAQSIDQQRIAVRADPRLYEQVLEQQAVALNAASLPPAVREKLWLATKEQIAASAVESLIEQNPWQAEKALRAAPGKSGSAAVEGLSPEARERALDKAGTEKDRRAEQGIANMLVSTVRPLVSSMPIGPGDMVDLAAAKGRAIEVARRQVGELSAEHIVRIENYVESVARDREQQVRRGRESALATAMDQVDANGGDVEALIASDPKVLDGLDRDGRERLNRYAGLVATGATRLTDWKSYGELIEDPRLLASVNLESMRDRFSAREFTQLKDAQAKLLTDPTEEQNIVVTSSLLKGMLKEAGVGKNDQKSQARFYSLLQQAVDQKLAATGKKKLPQTRIKELAEDLLVREVTSRGVLWDSRDEAFEIEVPPAERVKIAAALDAQGLPVTEYNVLTAYRAKLRKQGQP